MQGGWLHSIQSKKYNEHEYSETDVTMNVTSNEM